MVSPIIQKDRDRFFPVECTQLQKHLANALGVDIGAVANGMDFQADGIQRTQHIPPAPSAR